MPILFLALSFAQLALADPCRFRADRPFTGTPAEQARCLLRKVLPGGIVGASPVVLPGFLANAVGKQVTVSRERLAAYLEGHGIADSEIGGSIRNPVSGNGSIPALYFVIHDTSDEVRTFPRDMDRPSWIGNRLDIRDLSVAHVFVNRVGQSATGNEYSEPLTATKREMRNDNLEGLFLHHELVQPRVIGGGFRFHALGPQPGFSAKQLQRLALLYVVASVRRGIWMIPAYHCVIDTGIPDGHDDPQNFDLDRWSGYVQQLLAEID